MRAKNPSYKQLKSNLMEVEQAIEAIQDGQVDAIISTKNIMLLRLKEAEEALRQSEQRYRNLLEKNPDPVFCVDTQGRFTEVNEAACRFSGYSQEELLEKRWQDLFDPGDLKKTMQHFEAVLQGGSRDFEVSMIGKDSRRLYLYLTGGFLTIGKKIQGLFVIAHDITANKQAEQMRKAAHLEAVNQRNKLQAIMNALPSGIAIVDDKGGNIHANKAFEEIWGGPRPPANTIADYAKYKAWWVDTGERVKPEEWASAQAIQKRKTITGQILEIERFDGSHAYVLNSAAPILDAEGNITGSAVAIEDITKLLKAEEALHESEEKLALVASGTQIGIFDRDITTGEIIATEQNIRLLGLRTTTTTTTTTTTLSQHYHYMDWAKCVHPEDLARVEEEMNRCTAEHIPFESEYRVIWPDSSEHWIAVRAISQYDDNSKPQRMLGILMDITDKKKAEEALYELNLALETRIQERTEELNKTVEKLEQSTSFLLQAHRIANLGTWLWNIVDNKIIWSEGVYRIFGVKKENLADLNYEWAMSFVHHDDVDLVKKSLEEAIKTKKVCSIQYRIIQPDGNERIVKQRAEVVYNAADNPIRVVSSIQDVTEDKRKEERLHKQDLELKSKAELLDLAHDTIIVHGLDGKIKFWNRGAEKTYGWKNEEVLGKICHKVLKTKFSEPLLKIVSAVSTKGRWEGELIHTSQNKKQITVESRWALQKDENGNPLAILEIDRDITLRKAAEKKTHEAHRYAESIIATIQEALIVLDSEFKILRANDTFYKLFSLEPENTEGKFIYRLDQNQWDIPELRKLLEDVLPKNTSFEEYEMEYAPAKGSSKILLLNARRIYRDRKRTEMILLAIQDITARKQQEHRIRELTEELLLAEEEQRQEVAIALHDSIGQMLAFSKRELASLLEEPNLKINSSLKKVMESINKSIKQSRKLTTDLSSPTLHTFGLEAALEELAEQAEEDSGFKCRFKTTGEPKPLEKKIELLLYRSIKELLCNIAKHAKAKNVRIDMNTNDYALELIVTDDGKGFNTAHLNNNNNKKKSFGLFSIQQRLINIGGSFNIESEKNNGTKIILRVPSKITTDKKGNKNGC